MDIADSPYSRDLKSVLKNIKVFSEIVLGSNFLLFLMGYEGASAERATIDKVNDNIFMLTMNLYCFNLTLA